MRLSGTMTKFWLLPVLLALWMIGGCGSAPKTIAPPKATPAIPAIQPKAATIQTAVQAGAKPTQKLSADVATLPPSPQATLVTSDTKAILAWFDSLQKPVVDLQAAAQATDTAAVEVKKGEAERDAAIKTQASDNAALQKKIEQYQSQTQREIAWLIFWTILLTAGGVAVCIVLVHDVKLAATIGTIGAVVLATLTFMGWFDRNKLLILTVIVIVCGAYVIIETIYRKYHDKLGWWAAFIKAITTSPAEDIQAISSPTPPAAASASPAAGGPLPSPESGNATPTSASVPFGLAPNVVK